MKTFLKLICVPLMVILLCSMNIYSEQKRHRSIPDPKKIVSSHTMKCSHEEIQKFLATNDLRRKHAMETFKPLQAPLR